NEHHPAHGGRAHFDLMMLGFLHTDDLADLVVAQNTQQRTAPNRRHDEGQAGQAEGKGNLSHDSTSKAAVMRSICRPCEPLINTASFVVRLLSSQVTMGSNSSNSKTLVDF